MKKIKYLIISLITIFAFNINVFAASGSLGVSSSSVYVGDSFTVTANVSSAAAWNIYVSASGPVSGCSINQADATADAMDTNKTFSATCTATGIGTITIRLSGDVTSASDGNAVNVSGSRSVTVSAKPTPPSNSNNNNNNNNNNNSNNNNNNNFSNNNSNNQATDNRSKNNNIKKLSVEGYDLTKVDNNNYTLSVPNDVTSININATVEDSKSKVTGVGSHDINVGENNIEIIVTAENGSQNKITIKVTRKDGYYLEDLDSVLKNNKVKDINITIKSDTKITAQELEKIKNRNKTVKFNYYSDDKNLMYSWIIDGKKLKDTNEFLTTISNESENKKDILRLSNYADGLYFSMRHKGNLPTGTKIKLYVGDKFDNNDVVNVYSYIKNSDKLDLTKSKIKVKGGYIEFDTWEASDFLVTMSTVPNSSEVVITSEKSSSILLPLLIFIIVLLIIMIIVMCFFRKRKSNKNDKNIFGNNISTSRDDYENVNVKTTTTQNINNTLNDYSSYDNSNINNTSNDYSSYNNNNINNTLSNNSSYSNQTENTIGTNYNDNNSMNNQNNNGSLFN